MKIKNVIGSKTAQMICVILVICCVTFTLMPHLHDCGEFECSVCDLTKTLKEALCMLVAHSCAMFGIALFTSFLIIDGTVISTRENTPVGRKVKLSD